MKKLKTLFKKDFNNKITRKVDPENEWVLTHGIPTRKFDGTTCAIIDGELYKRFDLKKGRTLPDNAIPCQEADATTGHHPHWVKCVRGDSGSKWHFVGFDALEDKADGTYELCGEKVQRNPEGVIGHKLIKHGCEVLILSDYSYDVIVDYLWDADIEGIVFHHRDDSRMCKIRKSDFGIKR